jgi:hypothetical protein
MCREVFPSIVKPNNNVVAIKVIVVFGVFNDIFLMIEIVFFFYVLVLWNAWYY